MNGYLFSISGSAVNYREQVIVGRVIDGDTLKTADGRTIRLLNINTPEKNEYGHELGENFLKNFENKSVEVEITGTDKYKRNLARIYSGRYLNLEIVQLGFAKKFLVDKNELSEFDNAEREAINNGLGIWKKSSYWNCLKGDIDKSKEIVHFTKLCKVNAVGWSVSDESRKSYTFSKDFSLVSLHSGYGADNTTDIFWNSKTDVWNNDRDSMYARDSAGGLIEYESYGY